ncbi:MAG: DUF1194 domain-containing protein [Proteobacteria bacterium]|nr:DUF1194 domain-containing protein [Pseudomonadota bacterium]
MSCWRGHTGSRAFLLAWLIFLGLGGAAAAQTLRQVDLELVLAIDCSYSVDAREFELQKIGLAQAFRNPGVLAAIQAGKHKTIAVSVVEWSKPGVQEVVVPWTLVRDGAGAEALAARIEAVPRLTAEGATSISSMIRFGIAYLAANPISGARRVIDISADGRNNAGRKIAAAGALARAYGVTVNGLAILNEIPTLHFYFEQQVISGPDAFVMEANDYEDYAVAILRKLIREIGDPAVS